MKPYAGTRAKVNGAAVGPAILRGTSREPHRSRTIGALRILTAAGALVMATAAHAMTPGEVLVVANTRSPASVEIAATYRRARGIPADHLVTISTDPVEQIDRRTFSEEVERPIAEALLSRRLVDHVLVIVLTKDVPLKITGTSGPNGTAASVDSELTLLYRTLVLGPHPIEGRIANPYFRPEAPAPFVRRDFDTYLVTRLDAYTTADALAIITRGAATSAAGASRGLVVLEPKPSRLRDLVRGAPAAGNNWLTLAKQRLESRGVSVVVREGGTRREPPGVVIGYAGWGSNEPGNTERTPRLRWAPGAIGAWFVSTSARTFKSPPPGWSIGSWSDAHTFFAGSPQSLIGDLIAEGITGASGSVYEPYLNGTARPDIFLPAYVGGYTLAESFYMALPDLSWQAVVVGDPLAAPFAPLTPPPAPAVGLAIFLQRRAVARERAAEMLRTEASGRVASTAYADLALECVREHRLGDAAAFAAHAVELGPKEPDALYALGATYEARGDAHRAEALFRRVVTLDPHAPAAMRALQRLRALTPP